MDIIEVVAASIIAYRENGSRVIQDDNIWSINPQEETKTWGNKSRMLRYLNETATPEIPQIGITDSDRKQARDMINDINNDSLMSLLRGERVRGFVKSLVGLLSKEVHTDIELIRSVNILSYVPLVAAGIATKRDNELKAHTFTKSRHLGKTGDKVEYDVVIHQCLFSHNYQCYFITTYTAENNVIRFSSRTSFVEGETCKIRGRIKDHIYNSWKGEPSYPLTKLSHVKRV